MKAWLITWEWIGEHAKKKDKIASILNSRLKSEKIKEFTNQIYIDALNIEDKLYFAKNPKENPYPAKYSKVNGLVCYFDIMCGHNPFLNARLVENIKLEEDSFGNKYIKFKEALFPKKKSKYGTYQSRPLKYKKIYSSIKIL